MRLQGVLRGARRIVATAALKSTDMVGMGGRLIVTQLNIMQVQWVSDLMLRLPPSQCVGQRIALNPRVELLKPPPADAPADAAQLVTGERRRLARRGERGTAAAASAAVVPHLFIPGDLLVLADQVLRRQPVPHVLPVDTEKARSMFRGIHNYETDFNRI